MDQTQPVAIITGAGRGIGRATAIEFAKAGYRVVLAGRDRDALDESAKLAGGGLVVPTDVTQPDDVQRLISTTLERLGRIDALVNNAGLAPIRSIAEMSIDEWHAVIDTNLSAAFYTTRTAWPVFERQKSGVVVNISSAAARDPFPGFAAYGAAKAGINLFGLAAAREGAKIGVRVHTIAPAATETAMFRQIMSEKQYPREKTLDPADVARVVLQCVKGDLQYASGEVIYLHKTLEDIPAARRWQNFSAVAASNAARSFPMKRANWSTKVILILAIFVVDAAQAQRVNGRLVGRPGAVGTAGTVNLPYLVQDNHNNQWRVYQGGWLQQQGNQPIFSQGAQLMINGNQPNMNNNQGKLDEKTGELVLENLNANGLIVTRRILVDKDQSLVRYIDIIKNTTGQPAQVQIQIQTNFNYGVTATQTVPDPKRKGQELAWVAQTGAGPSVMEIFSGKGAKSAFQIIGPAQNSYIQATINPTIPAGKEVAIMHYHGIVASVDAGAQYVKSMKESQMMRSIPKEIRKLIINFASGQNFIGDIEILRGDLLDVVELKGGDQYKGTLKETSFALDTFYGKVDLPVDQVIGLINVGRFRPRQLLVTTDGQIFGGKLGKDTIDLELSNKQVIKVPLTQITRVGYRKRSGEPDEWTFEKPLVLMRTGERVGVQMPTEPVSIVTRYGKLLVKPETIAAVILQSEEHGVHEIRLIDGSRFAGLLDAASFTMKLDNASGQAVTFPASSVSRIQFTSKVAEADDDSVATITLANDDMLIGALNGKVSLDTAFDTIGINTEEIKSLTHPTPGSLDVSLTLWDGTTLSGQLQEQELSCQLASGLAVKVPVQLVQEYQQPQPVPSTAMKDRIKATVADLNAEDWKQRDRAEATLTGMGPVAIGILKELRKSQPPEAQQRIDSIVKELEKQRDTNAKSGSSGAAKPAGAAPGAGAVPEVNLELQVDN